MSISSQLLWKDLNDSFIGKQAKASYTIEWHTEPFFTTWTISKSDWKFIIRWFSMKSLPHYINDADKIELT